ncbi:MAG: hypothetical protein IT307_12160 [Chloroflexi bacterium]|nr:hypothetical protein [Chloroflexota bacterium]
MGQAAVREAVDAFFADARRRFAAGGVAADALLALGGQLAALAEVIYSPRAHTAAMEDPTVISSVLRTDPDGMTLVKVRFTSPREAAAVHEHRAWYVLRVISGQEQYTEFERLDDGSQEGYAELRAGPTRLLGPGDILTTLTPVIHLHEDYQGQGVDELMLLGENPGAIPVRRFDPAAKTTWVSAPRRYG